MDLTVIFLGTAGSVPTPERSLPAIAIRRKGEILLFDCGEGVQRQMIKAGISLHRKMKIFITHMHGDHVLGLPGLIQSMSLLNREKTLEIYGPEGIKIFIESIKQTVKFTQTFPLEVFELKKSGEVCETEEFKVLAIEADHVIPSFAYALVEKPRPGIFNAKKAEELGIPEGPLRSRLQRGFSIKLPNGRVIHPSEVVGPQRRGRKIVYTGDTRAFEGLVEFAKGADLLIHDATLDDELAEEAYEDGHSTPSQAAEIAKKAGVKKLVLTHISARYKSTEKLLEQSRRIFPNTLVAEDFMKISIPLPKD